MRKCGKKGKKKEGVAEGNRCEVGEVEGYIQSGYGNIIAPFGGGKRGRFCQAQGVASSGRSWSGLV